jgi:hypothetical protein
MATNRGKTGTVWPHWLLLGCCLAALAAAAAPRVELELVTEADAPITAAHRWLEVLKDAGFSNVRIRAAQSGDKTGIRSLGSAAAPGYEVTGVLRRNRLLVPGGEFGQSDKSAIAAWVARLQEGGQAGLFERPATFGLTAKELVAVHDALKFPVTISTKGQQPFGVLKEIARSLKLPFSADAEARQMLNGPDPVADELRGLSAGTAMAAVLRPLGLVLVPAKQGREIKLLIMDVRQATESWPVGWPSEKPPRETLPDLFSFLNVDIQDTPLTEALDALSQRLKTPFLFDHNGLARHRIDLTKKVSLPGKRLYYLQILDLVLNQAGLKSDLRVDEAGTPFLWISPLKK